MPFDCSQIIWNDAPPLPLPESEVVNKATALTQTVNRQLHPKPDDDSRVSPALRSAIQKSGMVLLDDFGDIVLKTQDLCSSQDECIRLKNALVNLGNSKDWDSLVNAPKRDDWMASTCCCVRSALNRWITWSPPPPRRL
jgi:hypothetical protein